MHSLHRVKTAAVLPYIRVLLLVVCFAWISAPIVAYRPGSTKSSDFMVFWAAAKLVRTGGAPYSTSQLLALERAEGWIDGEYMVYRYPPWALVIFIPLSLLPLNTASVIWYSFNLLLFIICSYFLFIYYLPYSKYKWLFIIGVMLYFPISSALAVGSISALLLLSILCFLWFQGKRKDFIAGLFLSFLLIKPHIVLMFFIALIIWVIRQKRWGMFIGLGTAIFAGTGLMIAFSPNAFDEFASVFDRLAIYPTPTLMNLLRDKFMHWKYPELAYLPALFLAPLTAMWVFRKSSEWSWKWTVSPLLVFSILAAPYTWHHDWIVLLPVILSIFVALRFHKHWITYLVVILLILAQFVLLIQAIVWPSYTIGGFWFPFLLAGIYYVSLKYQHAVPTK